jgi:transcriptional antiterminator RfaH
MKQWYTLHTKPNCEYHVAAALQRRKIETYLPEFKSPKATQKEKERPFFPCYLFMNVDLEAASFSQLQWIPGLRRIIAFDGRPAPMPQKVIDLIRGKLDELKANGDRPAHPFEPGDTVRITDGPFQNMLGIFNGPTTPAERVQVLLNVLGQANRVQVNTADLEKASSDAGTSASRRIRRTRGRGRRIKGTT